MSFKTKVYSEDGTGMVEVELSDTDCYEAASSFLDALETFGDSMPFSMSEVTGHESSQDYYLGSSALWHIVNQFRENIKE